jgi:hypothetical protein
MIDPAQLSGLHFPALGGPALPDVAAAVRTIAQPRQVVALDVAATWRHRPHADRRRSRRRPRGSRCRDMIRGREQHGDADRRLFRNTR